jgi:uncharacterized protein YndB with AHSA1/START domain
MTPSDRELRLERTFRAAPDRVFAAFTHVDVLRRWWAPGVGWDIPIAEVDLKVGGRMRLVMRNPEGEVYGGHGEFVEVDPPRRLAYVWTWDNEPDAAPQFVEVDFAQTDDGSTLVVLTNKGLRDEAALEDHRDGWQLSFDNLAILLSSQ